MRGTPTERPNLPADCAADGGGATSSTMMSADIVRGLLVAGMSVLCRVWRLCAGLPTIAGPASPAAWAGEGCAGVGAPSLARSFLMRAERLKLSKLGGTGLRWGGVLGCSSAGRARTSAGWTGGGSWPSGEVVPVVVVVTAVADSVGLIACVRAW